MTTKTASATPATQHPSIEVSGFVARIRDAKAEAEREKLIGELIVFLYPHFKHWAPQFCRVSGDVNRQHLDDVVHVSVERSMTMLRELVDPNKHKNVTNWYSYLYGACRYASQSYFHSGEVTVASGMTSALRRQRQLGRMREKLRGNLGREPEDQELIDAVNADMRARRSNPEKQGVLVNLADLQLITPAADFNDYDRAIDDSDDDSPIAPVEGKKLVRTIIERCDQVSTVYGRTARVWIGGMYAEPPVLGTTGDVAKELSIGLVEADTVLETVRGIARDIARREFGVDLPA